MVQIPRRKTVLRPACPELVEGLSTNGVDGAGVVGGVLEAAAQVAASNAAAAVAGKGDQQPQRWEAVQPPAKYMVPSLGPGIGKG